MGKFNRLPIQTVAINKKKKANPMNIKLKELVNFGRKGLLGTFLVVGLLSSASAGDLNPAAISTTATSLRRDPHTQRDFWHYSVKTKLSGISGVTKVLFDLGGPTFTATPQDHLVYEAKDVKALPGSSYSTVLYHGDRVIARKTQLFPIPKK